MTGFFYSISGLATGFSWKITGYSYDQVLTQLVRQYKFVIRDNGLGIQLMMKTLSTMSCQICLTDVYETRNKFY